MENVYNNDVLNALVRRIFLIEDITEGTGKQKYILRYRGHLALEDTASAYDMLASDLKPLGLTPLFRWEADRQAILLVPGMPQVKPSNPVVNLVLGILTILSVLLAGATYGIAGPLPANPLEAAGVMLQQGWPFAVSLLAILGAHEFGHYLAGRFHGVHVTLPYFIPFPFSPFGTMGAFINMKEPPKNRRILLDIGLAGPLAGMIIAVPVLLLGLSLSNLDRLPAILPPGQMWQLEGNSLLYLLGKFLIFKQWLPLPTSYGNLPPLLYWVRYFFTGRPVPFGGTDVILHPVAWAAWAGFLVTSLNLIPAGQLDGGHMLYVLVGRKWAERILPFVLVAVVVLGFFWNGWWLWAVLIFFLGRTFAEPLDQITPLDPTRRWLAILALILFILVFTPVPLIIIG